MCASSSASMLRRDLCARAQQFAAKGGHLHELSAGSEPVVIFGCDERRRHGNFHPVSYSRLCVEPDWARRLTKAHTASLRSRARHDWRWMELDSCCSSDALLMNIFCHPGVFDGSRLSPIVAGLLGVDPETRPGFGVQRGAPFRPNPRSRAKTDRTEVDLILGNLFVEAKLTEGDFQTARLDLIERYRDLEKVFDISRLPQRIAATKIPPNVNPEDPTVHLTTRPARVSIGGYQLIRNVLAAYAEGAAFCVLCDRRRQDLIECWYEVMSAVHAPGLSPRLQLLTWQELASYLPSDLSDFLAVKYGIEP